MKKVLIFILAAILFFGLMQKTKGNPPETQNKEPVSFSSDSTVAAWVWKSPDSLTKAEVEELLSYAEKEKINTLYVDISKYLEIAEETNSKARRQKTDVFNQAVKTLLTKAKEHHISIEALGGGNNWANYSHEYIAPLLVDYVFNFNKENPEVRFSGIQFDIEFYSQEDFKNSRDSYTADFLRTVESLAQKIDEYNRKTGYNVKLGFAIPFWLDGPHGGVSLDPLLDRLNKTKYSYVAVMAYRNSPSGRDGTISLVRGILDYTDNNAKNVSVIVGQETDVGESPKTTFYYLSKRDLKKAVETITKSLKVYQTFSGIAIHHLYSYKNLKDN
jgi:hypothetical protein